MTASIDPRSILTAIRSMVVDAGIPTEQIDGIAHIGGYQPDSPDPTHNTFVGFSLPAFISHISSAIPIDKVAATLRSSHANIPADIGTSYLTDILPTVARPIVQKLIDSAVITADSIFVIDITEKSFETELVASITDSGPFDAKLSAPEGLTISWSGSPIGRLLIPDIEIIGDEGARINTKCTFEIMDVQHMGEFVKTLLTEETFEWVISANNVVASALGITIPGINIPSKIMKLNGFDGLKNVVVESFDLVSDHPAGGVELKFETRITNTSNFGLSVDRLGLDVFIGDTLLGPVSTSTFTLPANSSAAIAFTGRAIPQTSETDLDVISRAATAFIHGEAPELTFRGDYAGHDSVTWLTEGFKALSSKTTLPTQGKLDVVRFIEVDEAELHIADIFSPSTSSDSVKIKFEFPFTLPLDFIELKLNLFSFLGGREFISARLPSVPSKTELGTGIAQVQYKNHPLCVPDHATEMFSQFLKDNATGKKETSLTISGALDVKVRTAIGVLTFNDITFSHLDYHVSGVEGILEGLEALTLDALQGVPSIKVRAKAIPHLKK